MATTELERLTSMTVGELKAEAKHRKIKGYSTKRKPELITLILTDMINNENNVLREKHPNLYKFAENEVGGDPNKVVYNILEQVKEDIETGDPIGVYGMKQIIWSSAEWPLFVDPGSDALFNRLDGQINDLVALTCMQAIVKDDPHFRYDEGEKELTFSD